MYYAAAIHFTTLYFFKLHLIDCRCCDGSVPGFAEPHTRLLGAPGGRRAFRRVCRYRMDTGTHAEPGKFGRCLSVENCTARSGDNRDTVPDQCDLRVNSKN